MLLPQYKGSFVPIAIYLILCAALSLVATLMIRDRSRVDINVEYDLQEATGREPVRRISPAG